MPTNRNTSLRYDPQAIDTKWQARWESDGLHRTKDDDPKPKWYALTMYPYPSGDLHIGHWYAMSPADTYARFMRMKGYNVLFPMGFDAFGLPAENAAIRNQVDPSEWTFANIERMRKQLKSMGPVFDWEREVITCDPDYYRWNQWLFLKLYEKGLAYRAQAAVNWCPGCQTVLANEQVVDGKCERSQDVVIRREMEQWFLRITSYADELIDFSKVIDWPERIKSMQTNWVGRSEGVKVGFDISEYSLDQDDISVFTTRIDTIFGVTFLALAPENPLVDLLTTDENRNAVNGYVNKARESTEIERLSSEREQTGVPTGAYAINKINGERIPILVADYVLHSYGTGAVMGVPAHDDRDFYFAKKYGLDIRLVVAPLDWDGTTELKEAFTEKHSGILTSSGAFTGMSAADGYEAIADEVNDRGWGGSTVSYRMRDWLISRQRYWGTPIPIVHCEKCGTVPLPESQLPVSLPSGVEFSPTGESPLNYHSDFVHTKCPACGLDAKRETDTMDTFVDSSWYFLRYLSPRFDKNPVDFEKVKLWGAVDQYMGGAEHAVMHLLYARFITKAIRDLGIIDFDEPFLRLFNQGVILSNHAKMSKSRGNVIAPDDYVNELGADVVRLYLMFLGPWESGGDWSDAGINGVARWVTRVWDICNQDSDQLLNSSVSGDRSLLRKLHQTIYRVNNDLQKFKFNTAIAALMEMTNFMNPMFEKKEISRIVWDESVSKLLILLAPMAPHLSEELWEITGHAYSIHDQLIPEWEEALAAVDTVTMIVQVNGKLRDRIEVAAGIDDSAAKEIALQSERVAAYTKDKQIIKVVYVPDRYLVSIVVKH